MRGGAIPIMAWGVLLLVLFIGNWIWDKKPVNAATAAFAAVAIFITAVLVLIASGRGALRRGPPEARPDPEALPSGSAAAAGVGIAAGLILFGIAWSKFFVYFGAGVMLLSLGRLWLELRAERATRKEAERGGD